MALPIPPLLALITTITSDLPCDSCFVSSIQVDGPLPYLVTRRRRQRPSAKLLFAPLSPSFFLFWLFLPPFLSHCSRCRLIDLLLPSPVPPLSLSLSLFHFPSHTSQSHHHPQQQQQQPFFYYFTIARLADCFAPSSSSLSLHSCYRSVLVLHSSSVSSSTTAATTTNHCSPR